MAPIVGRTEPDEDGICYPIVKVHYCTCGTWDTRHEPNCGLEPDDSRPIHVGKGRK